MDQEVHGLGTNVMPEEGLESDELEEDLSILLDELPEPQKTEYKEGKLSLSTMNLIFRRNNEKHAKKIRRSQLPPLVGAVSVGSGTDECKFPISVTTSGSTGESRVTTVYCAPICSTTPTVTQVCPPPFSNHHTPFTTLAQFPYFNTPINQNNSVAASAAPYMSIISGKKVPEISVFDESDLQSLDEYFIIFENFCNTKYGSDRQYWLMALENKLKGSFLTYYKMNGGPTSNYNIIKNQLLSYYKTTKELGNIQQVSFSNVKYGGEKIHDYMAKVRFLFTKAYPLIDPETSDELYEKLKNTLPEKTKKLVASKYVEMKSMFNMKMSYSGIQNFVLALESCNETLVSESSPTYSYSDAENDKGEREVVKPVRPRVYFNSSRNVNQEKSETKEKCMHCSRLGHVSEKCFKRLGLCYRCGSDTHLISKCEEKPKSLREKEVEKMVIPVCQYCDKKGHIAKFCWFANPKLRPKREERNEHTESNKDNNNLSEKVTTKVNSGVTLGVKNRYEVFCDEIDNEIPATEINKENSPTDCDFEEPTDINEISSKEESPENEKEPDYYERFLAPDLRLVTPDVSPIALSYTETPEHLSTLQPIRVPIEDISKIHQNIFLVKTKYEALLLNLEHIKNETSSEITRKIKLNMTQISNIEQKLKFSNFLEHSDFTNLCSIMLDLTDFQINILQLRAEEKNSAIAEFLHLCDELSVSNISSTMTSLKNIQHTEIATLSGNLINIPLLPEQRRLRADAPICKQFSSSHNFHQGRLTRNKA